jgi:hypothetical protein
MKAEIPSSTRNVSLQASGTLLSAFYSYPQLYVTWNTSNLSATNGINILQITNLNGVTANIQFPTANAATTTTEVVIPLVCKSLSVIQDANA